MCNAMSVIDAKTPPPSAHRNDPFVVVSSVSSLSCADEKAGPLESDKRLQLSSEL